MSSSEPFPRLLRWALLAPLGIFALAWFVAALMGKLLPDKIVTGIALALLAAGALSELLAVPVAVFLMARDWRYVSGMNVLFTALAAIPLTLIAMVTWIAMFGHFHI